MEEGGKEMTRKEGQEEMSSKETNESSPEIESARREIAERVEDSETVKTESDLFDDVLQ